MLGYYFSLIVQGAWAATLGTFNGISQGIDVSVGRLHVGIYEHASGDLELRAPRQVGTAVGKNQALKHGSGSVAARYPAGKAVHFSDHNSLA
jgi:hypothetical protein